VTTENALFQGILWVASELYSPDEQATSVFMTNLAEGLAKRNINVKAITTQLSSNKESKKGLLNNVKVLRCWATTNNKNLILGRLLNGITGNITMMCAALWNIKRGDIALVVTNPPTLPFVILLACLIKKAKCIVRVDDVYPDMLVACEFCPKSSIIYKTFDLLWVYILKNADEIITLSQDMKDRIEQKTKNMTEIRVIPNWGDLDQIRPDPKMGKTFLKKYGLSNKFVLLWAGNMGYPHDVETLLYAMAKISDTPEVHWLFIGSGAKRLWLERQVADRGLKNATFLGPLPRAQQQTFLSACDIGLSSLVSGMTGISVPSRSYNILCAGKPILAVGEPSGEISRLILANNVGWVVSPGDSDGICTIIKEILNNRTSLIEKSVRARNVVEQNYSKEKILNGYVELITKTMLN